MGEILDINETGWRFDNSYARLPEVLFARVEPAPARAPEMVILNHKLAGGLGLDFSDLPTEAAAALFTGGAPPNGAEPIAQAYAGHQFGHLAILGDGRAHLLGEHLTPDDRRVDIQFKGSGRTPYSRNGDGRAALGPMLREYIISEALWALGVPTTRSLAVVSTGDRILRDGPLPGAVLTRVADSHLRVGTFEYAALLDDEAVLTQLVEYALKRHYPDKAEAENPALALLESVVESQAALITHWMRVGFIHGVMNTDNMTISGESIDFGPCAFMDAFDLHTVFSSIDRQGRYAYGNQPPIAQWNLARFAAALLPALAEDRDAAILLAQGAVTAYADIYQRKQLAMMREKLGLFGEEPEDEALGADLLTWMQDNSADYTNTFRALSNDARLAQGAFADPAFQAWLARWRERVGRNDQPLEASRDLMRAVNPAVIPRNHKVEAALSAAEAGDLGLVHALLDVLSDPYTDREGLDEYTAPAPPSDHRYQTFCGT